MKDTTNNFNIDLVIAYVNNKDTVWDNRNIDLSYFWRINEKTEEKLKYLREKGFTN